MQILWKWARRAILAVLLLMVVLLVALRSSVVQTWLVSTIGDELSEELGAEVSIGRVDLDFFRSLILEDLLVLDQQGDTLLFAGKATCVVNRLRPRHNRFTFRELSLEEVLFDLKVRERQQQTNMQFLLDRLAGKEEGIAKSELDLAVDELSLAKLEFRFKDHNVLDTTPGVDFNDLHVRELFLLAKDLSFLGDSLGIRIEGLSFQEHSGFKLNRLAGLLTVAPSGISVFQSELKTPLSTLQGDLAVSHEDFNSFQNATEEVYLRCQLDPSTVHTSDIAYFVDGLRHADLRFGLMGKLRGPINDLKARDLQLRFAQNTRFSGNVDLSGLPDIDNTYMFVQVDHLNTDHHDLATIPLRPFGSGKMLEVPQEVVRAGYLNFNGDITGFPSDLVAYGQLRTAAGQLRTDMSFEKDSLDFKYRGRFVADNLHLGTLLANKQLGLLNCDLRVDATGSDLESLSADLEGQVHQIQFNEYDIGSIEVNGLYAKKRFEGKLDSRDPSLEFNFDGLVDLQGIHPTLRFEANLYHADLMALGLTEDVDHSSLTTRLIVDALLDPNDPTGKLMVRDLSYCENNEQYDLGHLDLDTRAVPEGKELRLQSSIANGRITGIYNFRELAGAVKSVVFSTFPALQEEVVYAQADQVFDVELEVGNSDQLLAWVLPMLRIAPGTSLNGRLNTRTFDISCDLESSKLTWKGKDVDSLRLNVIQTMDVVALSLKAEKIMLNDSLYVNDLLFTSKGFQDEFESVLDWQGSGLGASGRIDLIGMVSGPENLFLELRPSQFDLKGQHWRTEGNSAIAINEREVQIDHLDVRDGKQSVEISGTISPDPSKTLEATFEAFDLADLNVLMPDGKIAFKGILEGEASVSNVYDIPLVRSYLCVDSLGLNEVDMGYLTLAAIWQSNKKALDLIGTLEKDGRLSMDLSGTVVPDHATDQINVNGHFKEMELVFLNALIPDAITDIHGTATGNVELDGMLTDPKMSGTLDLKDAGLRIKELNSSFTFNHTFKLYPGSFFFDFMEVHDEQYIPGRPGHKGIISGAINHNRFKDWNFDIFGNAENLLALNTTKSSNALYYGTAIATGELGIFGYANNLDIRVRARSEKGTDIVLPLGGSADVTMQEFIHFVNEDTLAQQEDVGPDLSGVSLDLDLEVTPDAEMALVFDAVNGDILKGRGEGNIRMEIDPSGDFSMRGDVMVHEGSYLFTLQNIISKRFILQHGGTIQWFGDPYRALLDLEAQYNTRTSLYDLMFEKKEAYRKRVPVNVQMHLSKTLLEPGIDFGIEVPTVDQDARAQVNAAINTQQELNRQVFSLIVLNKFLPPPNGVQTAQTTTGGVTATTTSEVLSNQVSNWLSGISEEFDIGLNYRPGDNVTESEVQLALSTQLFNDRVSINTNLGYQYGEAGYTAEDPNAIIGDFEVEYKLTADGKLRTKVFNVSNDHDLVNINQSPTTQGVGVSFQEDFDTLKELFCKLGNIFRPRRNDRDCGFQRSNERE